MPSLTYATWCGSNDIDMNMDEVQACGLCISRAVVSLRLCALANLANAYPSPFITFYPSIYHTGSIASGVDTYKSEPSSASVPLDAPARF